MSTAGALSDWESWLVRVDSYLSDVRALLSGSLLDPGDVPVPPPGPVPDVLALMVGSARGQLLAALSDAEESSDALRERIATANRWLGEPERRDLGVL